MGVEEETVVVRYDRAWLEGGRGLEEEESNSAGRASSPFFGAYMMGG